MIRTVNQINMYMYIVETVCNYSLNNIRVNINLIHCSYHQRNLVVAYSGSQKTYHNVCHD